jgi:hypothetical protein
MAEIREGSAYNQPLHRGCDLLPVRNGLRSITAFNHFFIVSLSNSCMITSDNDQRDLIL